MALNGKNGARINKFNFSRHLQSFLEINTTAVTTDGKNGRGLQTRSSSLSPKSPNVTEIHPATDSFVMKFGSILAELGHASVDSSVSDGRNPNTRVINCYLTLTLHVILERF